MLRCCLSSCRDQWMFHHKSWIAVRVPCCFKRPVDYLLVPYATWGRLPEPNYNMWMKDGWMFSYILAHRLSFFSSAIVCTVLLVLVSSLSRQAFWGHWLAVNPPASYFFELQWFLCTVLLLMHFPVKLIHRWFCQWLTAGNPQIQNRDLKKEMK